MDPSGKYDVDLVRSCAVSALNLIVQGTQEDCDSADLLIRTVMGHFGRPGVYELANAWLECALNAVAPNGPAPDGHVMASIWVQQMRITTGYTEPREMPPDEVTSLHRLVEYLFNARANLDSDSFTAIMGAAESRGPEEFGRFTGLLLVTCANTIRVAHSQPPSTSGDDAR